MGGGGQGEGGGSPDGKHSVEVYKNMYLFFSKRLWCAISVYM